MYISSLARTPDTSAGRVYVGPSYMLQSNGTRCASGWSSRLVIGIISSYERNNTTSRHPPSHQSVLVMVSVAPQDGLLSLKHDLVVSLCFLDDQPGSVLVQRECLALAFASSSAQNYYTMQQKWLWIVFIHKIRTTVIPSHSQSQSQETSFTVAPADSPCS